MDDNGTGIHPARLESPLLGNFVDGVVDYRGRPVLRTKSGCWRSAYFFMALAFLALSTLVPSNCKTADNGATSCSPQLQVILFFISLYLVAFAQGCHKPCLQAFGADQFDADNPEEHKAKSSFFNWWYFGMCVGPTVGIFVVSYIQDNLSWGLGFGILCIIMAFSLIIFMIGTITYRFGKKTEEKSAFLRIGHVFVKAARNWKTTLSRTSSEEETFGILPHQDSQQFSIDEAEEAKAILRLAPIWVSCLAYAIVCAQTSTLFTKQGTTMDRSIGSNFNLPAATLQSFIGLSVIILIPIYDTILVPLTRSITRKPSGITMLQRIGIGFVISIVSMVVAGLVETKRLETAREYGLIDDPNAMIPMKIWWLLPQYVLAGAGDVFTMVGLQEFFYDQVPSDLKSMGLALYLSIIGIGSFLSSFLISVVGKVTGGNGEDGWISNNMNLGHIDYFYYLLAGISLVMFFMYLYVTKSYVYNRGRAL